MHVVLVDRWSLYYIIYVKVQYIVLVVSETTCMHAAIYIYECMAFIQVVLLLQFAQMHAQVYNFNHNHYMHGRYIATIYIAILKRLYTIYAQLVLIPHACTCNNLNL